jgi:hypothetical protein
MLTERQPAECDRERGLFQAQQVDERGKTEEE